MPHTYEIPTSHINRVNIAISPNELEDASLHVALSNVHNPIGKIELTDWLVSPSTDETERQILEVTVYDNSRSEAFKDEDAERPSVRLRIPLGTIAILGRMQSLGLPSLEAEPTSEQHLFIGFAHTNEGDLITIQDPRSTNGSHILTEAELRDLHYREELATEEQALTNGSYPEDEWLYNGNIPRPEGGHMPMRPVYLGQVAGQKRA